MKVATATSWVILQGLLEQVLNNFLHLALLLASVSGFQVKWQSEQIQGLHIADTRAHIANFFLDRCGLRKFLVSLGLNFCRVLLNIQFTETKLMFHLITLGFSLE